MVAKEFLLKAELRTGLGSKHAAKIRKEGKIPAVVYGHKQEPESIAFGRHDFMEGLHHGHRLIDVEFGGRKEKLLVKAIQYDYLGKNIIHADLIRVDLSEKDKVEIALVFKGTAAGSDEGGLLEEHLGRIEIECTVAEIPEAIEVSVNNLDIGDTLHAGDITLPAGTKLLTNPETLIIACNLPVAAEEVEETAEEAEQAAGPEVITERKEEPQETTE